MKLKQPSSAGEGVNGFGGGAAQNGDASSVDMVIDGHEVSQRRFNTRDEELVRLMVQSLQDLGLRESAETLQRESGHQLESPTVSKFRRGVLTGDWEAVEHLLPTMDVSPKSLQVVKFLIREQKYKELLERQDTKRALAVLRQELTPLSTNPHNLHQLTSYLMCTSVDELKRTADWDGAAGGSRDRLLLELQKHISSAVMIPERRLESLVDQALQVQKSGCLYHNTIEDDRISLFTDHSCDSVDKHIYLWNLDGDVLHKWSGVRVMDLAVSKDGQFLIAISERKIRMFDLESKNEVAVMPEMDSITSVKIADDCRYALVNLSIQASAQANIQCAQEIHLWDLQERRLVRNYVGQKQGRFVIRSCFGGVAQNFVLSGSEGM
ncbi:WD repeat-containing protein 26 [Borealophlyctis nickersoniae]|nr:WD repeat-containing protein 26 [Borealophlyctis nickersoniae]